MVFPTSFLPFFTERRIRIRKYVPATCRVFVTMAIRGNFSHRRTVRLRKNQKGVDEDPKAVDERVESVTKEAKGNANCVKVVRQGVVETRKLPQDPIKARLLKATEREARKTVEKPIRESSSESSSDSENSTDSEMEEERSEGVRSVGEERIECVTEESYASRAARTAGPAPAINRNVNVNNSNHLPGRPCTAFFTPSQNTSATSVFEALDKAEIGERDILCLHRRQGGEVQITFVQKL